MPSRKPSEFQDPGMNSFCHYSIGAVGEWIVRTVGGLRPDPAQPGFERFIIQPQSGPGFESASLTYRSPHGLISIDWDMKKAGRFTLSVSVPPGSQARVVLPDGVEHQVTSGEHRFTTA